jgi:hypothetical protein
MGTQQTHPRRERTRPAFGLGQTYVTRTVHETVSAARIFLCLSRHRRGDWGDVCAEDWKRNDEALTGGARLFSAYTLGGDRKLWVITEAVGDDGHRAATTVLYPDEY